MRLEPLVLRVLLVQRGQLVPLVHRVRLEPPGRLVLRVPLVLTLR